MQKIADGIYVHRKKWICKESVGWSVENCLLVFKTLSDAQAYIDKRHSGCNKKEPVVVGEITFDQKLNKEVLMYE